MSTSPNNRDYGPGPCIWCGQHVTSHRKEAGCPDYTADYDPAWAADGDFGCDASPETTEEDGVGNHARPYDVRRWVERQAYYNKMLIAAVRAL
jgi:hypothetical protein